MTEIQLKSILKEFDTIHHFTTFLKNKITYKALSGV